MLAGLAFAAADLVLLTVVTPKFRTVFAQQNVHVDWPTALIVGTSTWVWITLFIMVVVTVVVKEIFVARKRVALAINVIFGACSFGFAVFCVAALFAPMVAVMEQMGG